jgi:hypothetical protein
MIMLITKPAAGEYAPYYGTYIGKVQPDNLMEALHLHTEKFTAFIGKAYPKPKLTTPMALRVSGR